MFGRRRQATVDWLNGKFRDRPEIAAANIAALNAGHAFGETAELGADVAAYTVPPAEIAPGLYSNVTGADALSWGLVARAPGAGLTLVFCSYPITPTSSLLIALPGLQDHGLVRLGP